jgi:hypothetical protein
MVESVRTGEDTYEEIPFFREHQVLEGFASFAERIEEIGKELILLFGCLLVIDVNPVIHLLETRKRDGG